MYPFTLTTDGRDIPDETWTSITAAKDRARYLHRRDGIPVVIVDRNGTRMCGITADGTETW